jgi:hypothetical protein
MKPLYAPTLIGLIEIVGGVLMLGALPFGNICATIPTIKVPGAYPYEETVRIPVPPADPDSSLLPTPAPFPYRDSVSPTPVHDSRMANARRPLSAKTVREAAFKYNGVAGFCDFLAALPADVSVFDAELGRTRALVKGGRVVRKNVAWLRKSKQEHVKPKERAVVSVEEIGARNPGS